MNGKQEPIRELSGKYKDYEYVIMFIPLGFRCGYVKLPEDNVYFGKSCENIPIDCHGGLTFAASYLGHDTEDSWWIGFDCGHANDACDAKAYRAYYGKEIAGILQYYNDPSSIKSREFCEQECKNIIDQLIEMDRMIKMEETFDEYIDEGKIEKTEVTDCEGCWVWESDMNYGRCKTCKRNYGDRYIKVED